MIDGIHMPGVSLEREVVLDSDETRGGENE